MFDALKGLGGLGNLGSLMTKAKEMQDKFRVLQEELAKKTVTADAAGGMVQATVNGRLELVKLQIDKSRVDVNDTEMLEDVIVAAVRAAQTRAAEVMKAEMSKAAGEMGLPPGMLPG
jgi:DNA-binding YbaB/EbfC family protein